MTDQIQYLSMALCAQHNAEVHQQLEAAGLGTKRLDAMADEAADAMLAGESVADYLARTSLNPDRLAELMAEVEDDDEGECDPAERVAISLAHDLALIVRDADESMLGLLRARGTPVCPVCEMARYAAGRIPAAIAECVLHFESEHGHNAGN